MNKAYKFRIYPDKEQRILLGKTFGCSRFLWNKMLSDKQEHYKLTGEFLKTTPARYKEEYPFLKEVDSLALCNVQLNQEKAYKSFFKNENDFPKFKSRKGSKNSYTTNFVNGNIQLSDTLLKLPKLGWIRIKKHRSVPENYKFKSVTVSMTPSGQYYASILFEYEPDIIPVKPESFLGLDYSMHELYVDSEGNRPEYPKYYRKSEKRLAREQRKLSKMEKDSKNRDKQRIRVAKAHQKVANQRRDFLHKQSRQITNACDCVCIEDLNMQTMAKSLNFGKSVHDNGWGMFTRMLSYKLEDQGKVLIKADKFFASTQTCHVCGCKNTQTKGIEGLSLREWDCPACGEHHDRDINAAINLKMEAMRRMAA